MSLADESQISVSRVSKTAWGAALHAWRTGNWSQLSELQRLACRAAGNSRPRRLPTRHLAPGA